MGTLEDKEARATRAVIGQLDGQIGHLGFILKKDGHPDVVRRIDEAMIWAGVSRAVMQGLADAAGHRAEAAEQEIARLRDFLERPVDAPAAASAPAPDPAARAQSDMIERARELLGPVETVHHFDRAVVLKVWSAHRRVLGKLARTRDLAGLADALEALGKAVVEKATGAELLGLILDLLNAARKRQRAAVDASELNYYLDALIYAYARWSLEAQCQILRLAPETPRISEDRIGDEARQRVLAIFGQLRAQVT